MRYTLLGKTGLRVSELVLGTMTFGEEWGWGAPQATCERMLDLYADAGGNFIDTANRYTEGASERMLGELLKGRRERFVLGTKFSLGTDREDLNANGNQRKNLVQALDASLRRLQTDYVDVLWVHARDVHTPVAELMRALDEQVRLGKVLYVGVSDWPAWEIAQAVTMAELRDWSPFVATQIHYNLIERSAERELLPMAHSLDLAVTAWSPLEEGLLTGKHLAGGQPGRAAERAPSDRERPIIEAVVAVAAELDATPAQVALAWLRSRPGYVMPIIGATSERQLQENLAAAELRLEPDQLERLDASGAIELGFPHDFLLDKDWAVYGHHTDRIDDRRFTVGRTMSDRGFR